MTNLRCTADQHAVSPLNIRPVESGIIPDHFSTGWKTYPAHHDLSDRARPIPAVFQTNIRSPRSRPAHCRSVHFSRAGESGGWSGLWCERALTRRWGVYDGTCQNLLRGARPCSSSPLIVSRDAFRHLDLSSLSDGWSISYSGGCLYIFLKYCFYHLSCLCNHFYGLSTLVGCWSSVFIRSIIYKVLNVLLITQFCG